MSRKEQEECIRETRVLSSLDSDFIIKYYDSFLERVRFVCVRMPAAMLAFWGPMRPHGCILEVTTTPPSGQCALLHRSRICGRPSPAWKWPCSAGPASGCMRGSNQQAAGSVGVCAGRQGGGE